MAASGGAVVEGPSPAPENRYDYVVSLRHPRFNTHICSGTLIAPSWILTLASCVDSVELPFAHINGYFRDGPFVEVFYLVAAMASLRLISVGHRDDSHRGT